MSRRIIRDVEEALSREIRRIIFDETRTIQLTILEDVFDPFTGNLIQMPIEPKFYDSAADAHNIQYPNFFIRLLKSREDRYTGRVIPYYGRTVMTPVESSPKGYNIVASELDGTIPAVGNIFYTSLFKIRKVLPNYLLRILQGVNKGTYIVDHIVVSNVGSHSIVVQPQLLNSLPTLVFDSNTRTIVFTSSVDLNTIKIGDTFTDVSLQNFSIVNIDISNNKIIIGGTLTPILSLGGLISRPGNIFQTIDVGPLFFIVMDPSNPVLIETEEGTLQAHGQSLGTSPQIPIDLYYLVRIDSKERETHVDVLNRMWEEFNPPRTGLPVIIRSQSSADQLLTQNITTGGSSTVFVSDNTKYNLNDPVFIFDDLMPSKKLDQTFSRPFVSRVIGKISTNQLQLQNVVPDSFTMANNTRVVSNAEYYILMFHFVDHATRDVEGSQYWCHEFTFWVQIFVERLEEANLLSDIHAIEAEPEIL